MKDISVTCSCGKIMAKIEDGRSKSTANIYPNFPKHVMKFSCSCGKNVDIVWKENIAGKGII